MKFQMVAADNTKSITFGRVKVIHIFGYNNQGADRFIQFFTKPKEEITNGDTPAVKSLYCPQGAPIDWQWPTGLELSELSIGISSTEVTYTGLGGATGVDISIIVETDFPYTANTVVVGDLTSAVASLQAWSEATGTASKKRLLRLDVINTGGDAAKALIQASDSASTTDDTTPPLHCPGSSVQSQFFFYKGGLRPYRQDGSTERFGCTIRMGTITAGYLVRPYSIIAGTDFAIRAIYDI